MLESRDEVKGYIGQDVILAADYSLGQVMVVVGTLFDYGFFNSIPFGTANILGAAKFRVAVTADEHRDGEGSWTFSTHESLREWAGGKFPARLDFVDSSLPVGTQMETIDNVVAVVPLQPGVKEIYYEKANELFWINNEETR